MSRMLKALQQIESRSGRPGPESDCAGGDSSVEAALARVEAAAVMIGSQQPEVPSVEQVSVRWPDLRGEDRVRACGKLADGVVSRLAPDGGATLVFASPDDADARTEVLIPLAAALVERTAGKVLLVDAGPRGGELSDRLGLSAARGLSDVLDGAIGWQQAVRRTSVPRLSVIPAAASARGAAQRIEPPDVAHLLDELRSEYRIVLVDAALSHREQLGRIGRCCDGAYLVVRLRQTTRRGLRKAAGMLRACHARLLGSVVVD